MKNNFIIAAILALLLLVFPAIAANMHIFAILSYDAAPYEAVLKGFEDYLARNKIEPPLKILRLSGNAARLVQVVPELKKDGNVLILALGSLATQETSRQAPDVPVVAGMILTPRDLAGKENATGVSLEFPIEVQFNWLKRILPESTNIGVIYNPAENGLRIETATRLANGMGLRLDSQAVHSPRDIPVVLENLAKRVTAIWGVSDKMVLTPQTAEEILLFSYQNRIPFIGLSSSWVKAGALYSLEWDYFDMGVQCAEMVQKVMQGTKIGSIPVAFPRKVFYCINLKTAKAMRIEIAKEVIDGAREVY